MAILLKQIKGQIRKSWFGYLSHWLNGGSMQGYLIHTNDPAIDCNEFLKQLYGETLEYLQRNEFKLKCRPAYLSVAQASQLQTEADVKKYMTDAVASHEIMAGGADVKSFDHRPLFFIENLDMLIERIDKISEQRKAATGRTEMWSGINWWFKEANDTGRFNVVLTAADLKASVFVDGRAGPYLVYHMHELKK